MVTWWIKLGSLSIIVLINPYKKIIKPRLKTPFKSITMSISIQFKLTLIIILKPKIHIFHKTLIEALQIVTTIVILNYQPFNINIHYPPKINIILILRQSIKSPILIPINNNLLIIISINIHINLKLNIIYVIKQNLIFIKLSPII